MLKSLSSFGENESLLNINADDLLVSRLEYLDDLQVSRPKRSFLQLTLSWATYK